MTRKRQHAAAPNGVRDFRHEEARRKNNPPAGIAAIYEPHEQKTNTYSYNPHLDPQLIWADKAQMIYKDPNRVRWHLLSEISANIKASPLPRERGLKLASPAAPQNSGQKGE